MYQFSIVAIINYHQNSSLRQQNLLLQSCRFQDWHNSHCAKIKVLGGLHSFLEALKENRNVLEVLRFYMGLLAPPPYHPLLSKSAGTDQDRSVLHLSLSSSLTAASRGSLLLGTHVEPTSQIFQDQFLILVSFSLAIATKSRWLYKVTESMFLAMNVFRSHSSVFHTGCGRSGDGFHTPR